MLMVFPRLLVLAATVDVRRTASWIAAMTSAAGLFLLQNADAEVSLPLAWAHGAVMAVVARGGLSSDMAAGLCGGRNAAVALAWALERAVWPLLGVAFVLVAGRGQPVVGLAAALGCAAASLLLASCRLLRCSASDAASGTLTVTAVASLLLMRLPSDVAVRATPILIIGGVWGSLAGGLVGLVVQADRRSRLGRESAAGGGPTGTSELRRWYLRLLMAVVLLGMVRWLFASKPLVGVYGVAVGLLVAGLTLPDAVLLFPGGGCDCWRSLARSLGQPTSRRFQFQAWLLPAIVAVWPLLVAVVLVPATRNLSAALATVALGVIVLLAGIGRRAVARRWCSRDTALAAVACVVWLATLDGFLQLENRTWPGSWGLTPQVNQGGGLRKVGQFLWNTESGASVDGGRRKALNQRVERAACGPSKISVEKPFGIARYNRYSAHDMRSDVGVLPLGSPPEGVICVRTTQLALASPILCTPAVRLRGDGDVLCFSGAGCCRWFCGKRAGAAGDDPRLGQHC